MPDRILSIRVSLADRLFQIQTLPCKSREVSLAVTSLQAGRMLLGSVAGLMGSANPYPQSDNPKSREIAPSSDIPPASPPLKETEPVAAVKEMRALLEGDIQILSALRRQLWRRHHGRLEEALFDRALTELILAKQWLGEQLAVLAGHPLVKAPAAVPPKRPASNAQRPTPNDGDVKSDTGNPPPSPAPTPETGAAPAAGETQTGTDAAAAA